MNQYRCWTVPINPVPVSFPRLGLLGHNYVTVSGSQLTAPKQPPSGARRPTRSNH